MTTTHTPRRPLPWEGFDIDHPSRVGAAVREIGDRLADGCWHSWTDTLSGIAERHGLQVKTVDLRLRGMIELGHVQRRGTCTRDRQRRRVTKDTRAVRLAIDRRSA
jgi:hypothetical protein